MRSSSLSCFLRPNEISFFHIDCFASAAATGSAAEASTASAFGLRPNEISFFQTDCFASAEATGSAAEASTASAFGLRPNEISFFKNDCFGSAAATGLRNGSLDRVGLRLAPERDLLLQERLLRLGRLDWDRRSDRSAAASGSAGFLRPSEISFFQNESLIV